VLGDLGQTTAGKWITRPPARCPNGHTLGPVQVLVGHIACLGHGGGGHTGWHCRTCDAEVLRAATQQALHGVGRPRGSADLILVGIAVDPTAGQNDPAARLKP
jgi:hypothetical protein